MPGPEKESLYMRITGGFLRGRPLISPDQKDPVRPTSDRARLAMMNMLESRGLLRGARVMDLFCGTGALGLEALSRGAASCIFVDAHKTSLDLARRNAQGLDLLSSSSFIMSHADAVSVRPADHAFLPATLVFMDPPYHENLVSGALSCLIQNKLVSPDTVFMIETEKEWTGSFPLGTVVLSEKAHGIARVTLLAFDPDIEIQEGKR